MIDNVNAMRRAYEAELKREAKKFRDRHLVPFCERHRVVFVSGMGEWALFLLAETSAGDDLTDARVRRRSKIPSKELRPILATLSAYICPFDVPVQTGRHDLFTGMGTFGYYVETYDTRKP